MQKYHLIPQGSGYALSTQKTFRTIVLDFGFRVGCFYVFDRIHGGVLELAAVGWMERR
jgi:ribosomal protein S2